MNASDKRKYLYEKILQYLSPYGYFARYGKIWRYSLEGKYVIQLNLDLTRWGMINDLNVFFGSFYMPIERRTNPYTFKTYNDFKLNHSDLIYYLRHVESLTYDSVVGKDPYAPFEEQVSLFMPYVAKAL